MAKYESIPEGWNNADLRVQIQAHVNDYSVTLWHYQIDESQEGWSVDAEGGDDFMNIAYFDDESEAAEAFKTEVTEATKQVVSVHVPFDPNLYIGELHN